MSIFEGLMLLCFGLAWPVSIVKALKSKTAKGRTPIFQIVLLLGYLSGITHKILYSMDIVLLLYCLNFAMVAVDTAIMLHYRKREPSPVT